MSTPSQLLASQITARLVREGILSAAGAKEIESKLATGGLKGEDWRLQVELASARAVKP